VGDGVSGAAPVVAGCTATCGQIENSELRIKLRAYACNPVTVVTVASAWRGRRMLDLTRERGSTRHDFQFRFPTFTPVRC
jgi:hypothetical protein